MKGRILKYAIIFVIFFLGLSIGSADNQKKVEKEIDYGDYENAQSIEKNAFTKLAKAGEKITEKTFIFFFESFEELFKKLLGV